MEVVEYSNRETIEAVHSKRKINSQQKYSEIHMIDLWTRKINEYYSIIRPTSNN